MEPPRKQNTACDACRARKVKCNKLPGHDKCQHCQTKNYPCTHHKQQATSEKKRAPNAQATATRRRTTSQPTESYVEISSRSTTPPDHDYRHGFYPPFNEHTSAMHGETFYELFATYPIVINYLFSPPESDTGHPSRGYAEWGDLADQLLEERHRKSFALDLIEVFFQIVHTRLPLLNPSQFREQVNLDSDQAHDDHSGVNPALLATVIAWGTKFSEHPILLRDRERTGRESRIGSIMISRARELAEAMKVHRRPSFENIVISLLIEPLQSRKYRVLSLLIYLENPDDDGFHGFWLTAATRHLMVLRINHRSVLLSILDPEARGMMVFAFWYSCIADAYSSVYYRRKPLLDDEDYDLDFYTADPVTSDAALNDLESPREKLEGYYSAAHALARISRQMSRGLWNPRIEANGIPFELVWKFSNLLELWEKEHLPRVGVRETHVGQWDFVAAVSACCSDATYHVHWIILFNALDDFGIREELQSSSQVAEIAALKSKIVERAFDSATRIAGLAGILTNNNYLKLDPAVMHISCIRAGTLLARDGRSAAQLCINGLYQYSYSYEEAGDQADEMARILALAQTGERDFKHAMSSLPQAADVYSPQQHHVSHHSLYGTLAGAMNSMELDHQHVAQQSYVRFG